VNTDPGSRTDPATATDPGSVLALWLGFTVFIVYGAIVPFHWVSDSGAVVERLHQLTAHPWAFSNQGDHLSISDVLQNLLLFLPFGALGVLAGDLRSAVRTRIAFVTGAAFALSVAVEALQLLTVDRVPSAGDVVVDTVGCILGAVLTAHFRPHILRGVQNLRSAGWIGVRELRPVAIALLLLAITWWQPFDVTLELGSIVRKMRFLERDFWQFWGWRRAGTQFMLTAFLTMALGRYLAAVDVRRPGWMAAFLSAALVFLLEAGQLFVESRMPGLADPVLASAGVAAGMAIWVLATRIEWPGWWLGALAMMTFGAATVQVMLSGAPATTFEAVSRTVDLALLFFPLGFAVGRAVSDRRRTYGLGIAIALTLGGSILAVAWWFGGRYAGVGVVGVSLAGVLLGLQFSSPKT